MDGTASATMPNEDAALQRRRSLHATALMSALFFCVGVSVPFLPRWLEAERSLNGPEIAAILASAQLFRLIVGPVLGAWADGFADRRIPPRLLSLLALASYLLFAVTPNWLGLVALGFCGASAVAALTPLFEGAALRAAGLGGWPFGIARSIGSGAFILGNVACGYHIKVSGAGVAIWWLIGGLAVTALLAWLAEPLEARALQQSGKLQARLGAWRLLWARPRLLLALAAAGPIQAAHGFFYGFATITWREQGIEPSIIGLLWGFGTLVEVGFFLTLARIERRLWPEWLVLAGGLAAILRWAAFALAPSLPWLWPLQGLHALTFAATHLGAMRIVYEEAPEEAAGLAGAVYAAVAGGSLLGVVTLLSGWLHDQLGAGGYGIMAGLSAIGVGFTLRLMGTARSRRLPPLRLPRLRPPPLGWPPAGRRD